jgi:general secretion pathway protein D
MKAWWLAGALLAVAATNGVSPPTAPTIRAQLESVRLPEVMFRETAVEEVVAFLLRRTRELSGNPRPINHVWLAPAETKTAPVTLTLRNILAAEALRYVTTLAGLRYRVDAHAVIIYQPAPEPVAPKNAQPD